MKKINKILLLILLITQTVLGYQKLTHYGVATINNSLSNLLAHRLNAKGKPLFIIQNVKIGVSQGDIIRFKNKAILITPDIWQTLKSIGVLQKLKGKNIITFKAKSKSRYWVKRKNIVNGGNSKKGYLLGAEILKIMEEYFKTSPKSEEIVLKFDNRYMSLVASKSLLKKLRFSRVKRIIKSGKPQIISPAPDKKKYFINDEFYWQIWAIDTKNPGANINYKFLSNNIDSLKWNKANHSISGTLKKSGLYKLKFEAISKNREKDTISFIIDVKKDYAPVIADIKDSIYNNGELFLKKIIASDFDHPSSEIELLLKSGPKNIILDSNNTVKWKIPNVNKTTYFPFEIEAKDPLGAKTVKRFIIEVNPKKIKKDIKKIIFNLPYDTLKQHKVYSWKNSRWIRKEINVEDVTGDSICYYKKLKNDGLLVIQPKKSGKFHLKFHFIVNNKDIYQTKTIYVKPNKKPFFKSILSSSIFRINDVVYYTPIAIDPDNDRVTIRTYINNKLITTPQTYIRLKTNKQGKYVYKFVATDIYGNSSEQYIGYDVKNEEKIFSGLEIEKIYKNNWNIDYRTNRIRFGLFSPDLYQTLTMTDFSSTDLPFVFIGVNLMPYSKAQKGNTFFLDGGMNIRAKSKRLTTGGIMIRSQGKFKNINGTPWVFEHTFQLYIKQALLLADTTGLEESVVNDFGKYALKSWQTIDMSNPINILTDYYPPIKNVLDEYSDHSNALFLLKMATWYPIGKGIWAGPTLWLAYEITGKFFENNVGIGIYHDWKNEMIAYRQSFRIGLNSSSTPSILWDLSIFIGK